MARALVNKANALGGVNKTAQALLIYDDVVTRLGTSAEPAQRYQVARALYNKGVTYEAVNDANGSLAVYASLAERFGDAQEENLRGLVAWALYNQAVGNGELGRTEIEEKLYNQIATQFDADATAECSEVVVLALNGLADNVIAAGKKLWAEGDEAGGKARLSQAQTYLTRAAERNESHPYVLGSQAYLDFLLGNTLRATETLARAIELGGEELRADELESARYEKLPIDEEFIQILQALPAGRNAAENASA